MRSCSLEGGGASSGLDEAKRASLTGPGVVVVPDGRDSGPSMACEVISEFLGGACGEVGVVGDLQIACHGRDAVQTSDVRQFVVPSDVQISSNGRETSETVEVRQRIVTPEGQIPADGSDVVESTETPQPTIGRDVELVSDERDSAQSFDVSQSAIARDLEGVAD